MSATDAAQVDPFSDEGLDALADEQAAVRSGEQTPADTAPEAPAAAEDELELDEEGEAEEEERLYAGKFRSVEALEESYRHAEQMVGRLGNELGQLRQGPPQQQLPYPAQQQVPQITEQQLLDAYDENPLQVMEYLVAARTAEALAEARAEWQQQIQPLAAHTSRMAASTVIAALGKELGEDVVTRNRTALAEAIQNDQDWFNVADEDTRYRRIRATLRDLDATNSAPRQSTRAPRQRGADGKFAPGQRTVHVEGGSNGARTPQSPADRYADLPYYAAEVYAEHDAARGLQTDRYGVRGPAR